MRSRYLGGDIPPPSIARPLALLLWFRVIRSVLAAAVVVLFFVAAASGVLPVR